MNNRSTLASTNKGLVERNSVQSQFSELTRERDLLRDAANAANRDRKIQERSIQALRETETSLKETMRKAHATLGMETKKRVLLQEEHKSKTKVLQEERREMDKLSRDLVDMKQAEQAKKIAFVKEMTIVNNDMEDALRLQEEIKLRRLVTVPTVKLLLETLGEVESKIPLDPQEREVLSVGILESLEVLKEATGKKEKEMKFLAELEQEAKELRAKAMKGQGTTEEGSKPLGEQELNELEVLWEQNWEEPSADESDTAEGGGSTHAETVGMQLFYGNSETSNVHVDTDHAVDNAVMQN